MKKKKDAEQQKEVRTYETFLCYRGGSIGHPVSMEIAAEIYGMTDEKEEFGGVFFAKSTGIAYDYIRDAEPIIRNTKRFVVVLCTDFFKGFFQNGSSISGADPESATCRELELAFQYNCDLYPILSGEFSWDKISRRELARLEEFYGKSNMDRLRHHSNAYRWKQGYNDPEEIKRYLLEPRFSGVLNFLRELGEETTRQFELDVTNFVMRNNSQSMRNWLEEIMKQSAEEERVRYAAFYTLQVMLRHLKDYAESRELYDAYRASFQDHPSFNHLWVLHVLENGSESEIVDALGLAYQDSLAFPGNAGFIHQFAVAFATVCEELDDEREAEAVNAKWGKRALKAIEKAIELDPKYAKYHCTKGRILAIDHDYTEAEKEINLAISLEDSRRSDYLIRLTDYQYYKILVRVKKRLPH